MKNFFDYKQILLILDFLKESIPVYAQQLDESE